MAGMREGNDMHTSVKIAIAIALLLVFAFVYIIFVGGATGQSGSFLDNFWKGIESLIPLK